MKLRPYQERLATAAKNYIRRSLPPCVLEAATGAGKSLIIADVAHWANREAQKGVLCLAPSKELVEQNYSKYLATGESASLFSASAGQKDLSQPVVFGTPRTVLNSVDKMLNRFSLIVIDECHGITPTIKKIISRLQESNKNIRVIGLSATPFRLDTGYIYKLNQDGAPVPKAVTKDPYFMKLIERISAWELIEEGYLTPPFADMPAGEAYDTSGITDINDKEQIRTAFEGHGRLTGHIVGQVCQLAVDRQGVMFFAATVPHAHEVLASLPEDQAAIVTGETPKNEREQILKDFKSKQIKYLVNVSVLTTGFDAEHVDVIAILRKTASAALLQQMIGRGLRLGNSAIGALETKEERRAAIASSNKPNCLVLDFANNIDELCKDRNVFDPNIEEIPEKGEGGTVKAVCELCNTINAFTARKNPEEFEIDRYGYFIDLEGQRIQSDCGQEMPGHYGRRCGAQMRQRDGSYKQCEHRWSAKECKECGHFNDIAARYCEECKAELVDPNEKLVSDFLKMKNDPFAKSTDSVQGWQINRHTSMRGNQVLRVAYKTEYRDFTVFYTPKMKKDWLFFCMTTLGQAIETPEQYLQKAHLSTMPNTITYQRKGEFFKVYAYNRSEDEIPNVAASNWQH